jgi:CRP-like cAMP-binding protein
MATSEQVGSRLLASLSPSEFEAIDGDLERVRLDPGKALVGAHETIKRVFFPDSGLIAYSIMLPDGRTAGVTMVGVEGIVGLSAMAGAPAVTDAVVQVAGVARTMHAERFRAALRAHEGFRELLESYALALQAHLAQTVACNRLHGLDQRAARWLLLAHERVEGLAFPLTQEAFADLLGVSRPAVSTVGARFARAGAAEFRRGTVHILDLAKLERASCECLDADREAFRAVQRQPIRHAPQPERSLGRGMGMIRPQIRRAR